MTQPEYGSDVIVDILAEQDIEYVAMNPGASFRGVHDSLVNYATGNPQIIETLHEKVAVGIAHGYAKMTGRPMGVFTHDLVGLMHATLGIYYAYVDRAPMMVLGGAGPMDQARRRPWIDWIHTANTQNETVRSYTKWDEHPYSVEAVPDALARALRVATMHPQGPVYVALDAGIQETTIGLPPDVSQPTPPMSPAADPRGLEHIASVMTGASRPAIVCGYVGRSAAVWRPLIELAETLNAAVVDTNFRLSFPSRHPLNATGTELVSRADAVLLLDVKDLGAHTGILQKDDRAMPPRLAEGAQLLDIGFGDLEISSWAAHQGALYRPELQLIADTDQAVPALLDRLRDLEQPDRAAWRREVNAAVSEKRTEWEARASSAGERIDTPSLVQHVGNVIDGHDWVLAAGNGGGWANRLWDMDQPHRHAGRSLGTATQIGISLGVALANRAIPGRLTVDLQPDGDLLYDPGALWTAAHHRIPMLVVMVNNRLYGNDLYHQREVAAARGRPLDRARIGIEIRRPDVDFATLARSFGWWAQGPVERQDRLEETLAAAVRHVTEQRSPALVDVVVTS